jgi:hypothetical protein
LLHGGEDHVTRWSGGRRLGGFGAASDRLQHYHGISITSASTALLAAGVQAGAHSGAARLTNPFTRTVRAVAPGAGFKTDSAGNGLGRLILAVTISSSSTPALRCREDPPNIVAMMRS